MSPSLLHRPLTKLLAFGVTLGVVFGAAYAVGVAVPDALDSSPSPAQVHDAPAPQGAHP